MQVEESRHREADRSLHDHDRDQQHDQQHELPAAACERTHVRAESERCEEGEQQRIPRRSIHRELEVRHHACHGKEQGEEHATDDRHGNAVALQEG